MKPNPQTLNYADGQKIQIGDVVGYSGTAGVVVAYAPTSEYLPGFAGWQKTLNGGFLIKLENGALLRFDEADEDLDLVRRAPG